MEIVVKNNSETTARSVNYKIRYYNKQGGDVVDTEYKTGTNVINGGDTVTETFILKIILMSMLKLYLLSNDAVRLPIQLAFQEMPLS